MKFKYFLRGVGIGIIVTAILLGISYKSNITDEDIILRAKKLGMEFAEDGKDDGADADATNEPLQTSQPFITSDPGMTAMPKITSKPEPSESAATTNEPDAPSGDGVQPSDETVSNDGVQPSDETISNDGVQAPDTDSSAGSDRIVKAVLKVRRGDWSRIVSENLLKLGIIDNAEAFDKYLVDNNYANKIIVGDFEVSSDNSFKEIAEAITE